MDTIETTRRANGLTSGLASADGGSCLEVECRKSGKTKKSTEKRWPPSDKSASRTVTLGRKLWSSYTTTRLQQPCHSAWLQKCQRERDSEILSATTSWVGLILLWKKRVYALAPGKFQFKFGPNVGGAPWKGTSPYKNSAAAYHVIILLTSFMLLKMPLSSLKTPKISLSLAWTTMAKSFGLNESVTNQYLGTISVTKKTFSPT